VNNSNNNFVTILTLNHPHELAIARGKLQSEGIECFVKDELTIQVNPFYSNAIGGAKLQVRESDIEKAVEILKEGGYIKDNDLQTPKLISDLDKFTSKLPFLNKLRLELRLMIIVSVIVVLITSIIYVVTLPTAYESLTGNTWCINNIVYDNKNYIPQTEAQIRFVRPGFCQEIITFRENGTVTLPGFKSSAVWGKWNVENNKLQIYQTDTFNLVYNGIYEIDYSNGILLLESPRTKIQCKAENYKFSF
jgi:hypothetical protein